VIKKLAPLKLKILRQVQPLAQKHIIRHTDR